MGNGIWWDMHRSGWQYALKMLEPLRDPTGIIFDGTLDYSFGAAATYKQTKKLIPYCDPWIGFFHSTIKLCPFLEKRQKGLDSVLASPLLKESLPFCKGVFTLSKNLAEYIGGKLGPGILVNSIKHPTEFPERTFSFADFLKVQKIIHVGAWSRAFTPFYRMKVPNLRKIMLLNPDTLAYLGLEIEYDKGLDLDMGSVLLMQHRSNEAYDDLLASGIVFLNLCDTSASNTIIECLSRATPLLVNKLPAVEEYLGADYPFYYDTLEEAETKAMDRRIVLETHEYMKNYPGREEIKGENFLRCFLESEIILSLKK